MDTLLLQQHIGVHLPLLTRIAMNFPLKQVHDETTRWNLASVVSALRLAHSAASHGVMDDLAQLESRVRPKVGGSAK